ncbi:MAG: pyrimidine 5'-nucleotidase [Alphaproteobacteria bacterium]
MSIAGLRGATLDWVFDLDNTLYPAESTMYDAIGVRMTDYIARAVGLDHAEAEALREHYFIEYGATVVGLHRHHNIDAGDFLAYVHDVDAELVRPDPELHNLIAALPGRKFVFTNGGGGHAERIVERLGFAGLFDDLFDIESAALEPKPQIGAYTRLIERFALQPERAVLIEDTLRNLMPAAELGFITVLIGPVHPEPAPAYVHHHAHDLKALLREILAIDPPAATA